MPGREDLLAERKRRRRAEALIHRAKGGGIRPGDFPTVRDVDRHVEKLADDALVWTEKACAIGGSNPALPSTIASILKNTFLVCREEVQRCLDQRLHSLSEFLGHNEPVVLSTLSDGDSMNLDTQYVLYECLCRNFRTIVESVHIDELADMIKQRCGEAADEKLASNVISGDACASFENLVKNYITVFVEVSLTVILTCSKLSPPPGSRFRLFHEHGWSTRLPGVRREGGRRSPHGVGRQRSIKLSTHHLGRVLYICCSLFDLLPSPLTEDRFPLLTTDDPSKTSNGLQRRPRQEQ